MTSRTQEQRSTETRARLMAAAVEVLLEKGYAGLSIGEVHQRADVARGTLLHHFPTKADLVAAAVIHLVDERIAAHTVAADGASSDSLDAGQALDTVVDQIWHDLSSPDFFAALELWVAGRTDPDLREAMLREEPRVLRAIQAGVEDRLRPAFGASPQLSDLVALTVQTLTGLSLRTMLGGRPSDADSMLRAWKRSLRVLMTDPELRTP